MKHPFAVKMIHISKRYNIHHEKPTLVEKFVKVQDETFWALSDINLVINKGDRVGIVGSNGSGKTTLLKVIAGITAPTNGGIEINGRIISLIDLNAGFHPELTGEQNIYLNGMLLGMTRKEINNKIASIIRFADINQFIDTPLFTYSSGMRLRLGFAVAIHARPDILVLDENLNVGDKNFQKKTSTILQKLIRRKTTLIIVTHLLEFIRMHCQRVILIDKGKIVKDGSIRVLDEYLAQKNAGVHRNLP